MNGSVRLEEAGWSRVDPRVRSPFCIDGTVLYRSDGTDAREIKLVLFILLDNNYDYKNKVQGYS